MKVEAENNLLQTRYQKRKEKRDRKIATVPSLLGAEKQTNPFLRWDIPALKSFTNHEEPARVFGILRGMKDLI